MSLPQRGRIALLSVVCFLLLADFLLYATNAESAWSDALTRFTLTVALGLFAWFPFSATTSLILVSLLEISYSNNAEHLIYVVFSVGLVAYTSPIVLTLVYLAAAAGLIALTWATSTDLTAIAPLALGLIGALSGIVGIAVRRSHRSESNLADKVIQLNEARAAEIQAERDRIADELHDIVAHEVTLISMHAKVLTKVNDHSLREKSIQAIQSCSDQALTDIRRMLNIIHDEPQKGSASSPPPEQGIIDVLNEIESKILALSGKVDINVDETLVIPASISKTLAHIAWESATNITKHAQDLSKVRISLTGDEDTLYLQLTSPLPNTYYQTEVPSSGYGIARLKERALLIGGRFSSQAVNNEWVAEAQLPRR